MGSYEVQGRRRTAGGPGGRQVDEVRLITAEDRVAALGAAAAMVADGFTVWVFRIDRESGRRTYVLVEKLPRSDG